MYRLSILDHKLLQRPHGRGNLWSSMIRNITNRTPANHLLTLASDHGERPDCRRRGS
jgi:hypothetical protein